MTNAFRPLIKCGVCGMTHAVTTRGVCLQAQENDRSGFVFQASDLEPPVTLEERIELLERAHNEMVDAVQKLQQDGEMTRRARRAVRAAWSWLRTR